MKFVCLLLFPFLLFSAPADRISDLVEEMRTLTFAGDQAAVGRLVPALVDELEKPGKEWSDGIAPMAWNQLGVYYQAQGNYPEAERAYLRGIRILEKTGRSDGETSLLLLNLAIVYLEVGKRPAQAEILSRKALKIATGIYGPDASVLASFMQVLAGARQQQGDRKAARGYLEQALTLIGNDEEGKFRHGVLLGNLVVLAAEEEKWNEARGYALRALQMMESSLGPTHPDLVRQHINLARIHENLREWPEASGSLSRAREIVETRLGPEHYLMAQILEASASIQQKTGRGREAREARRRAKSIMASQPRDRAGEAWIHAADLMRSGRR